MKKINKENLSNIQGGSFLGYVCTFGVIASATYVGCSLYNEFDHNKLASKALDAKNWCADKAQLTGSYISEKYSSLKEKVASYF